ncbi:hypothetical protein NLG97_g10962 [Lecanicillium saksenae]|uniref:Uncharacterized protein n=1 Tax=Lecanicillium saksenae TaxID=468837 RepID=A0ACC1QFJ9_9HYPO|nr:hypothetical protein NLG97_g10962 [Lecanicillium saksenae]
MVCQPWLVDGQQAQFPGPAMFPPLSVVDEGILQMLCETCEPPRPTARASSLKDLSLRKLIRAAETTPEFEPHVVSRVVRIPTVTADLRRLLPDATTEACWPASMVQLLRAAFRDCRDVRLVGVRGISCGVLTRALLSEELQATRTLSFAADALRNGASISELVRALERLPELTSVYVADVDAQPSEGSRMQTATAQRALMMQAREGEGQLVRKIAVSGYYVSKLMGMPMWELDGGKSFRGGRLPKEWRQRWA